MHLSYFFVKLYADDYTISGYVIDTKSEQYLIGINIYIEGTSLRSATDEKGYYKITILKEGTFGHSLKKQRIPIHDGSYP